MARPTTKGSTLHEAAFQVLDEIVAHAQLHGLDGDLLVAGSGDHDGGREGAAGGHRPEHLQAAQAGHRLVDDDRVVGMSPRRRPGPSRRRRRRRRRSPPAPGTSAPGAPGRRRPPCTALSVHASAPSAGRRQAFLACPERQTGMSALLEGRPCRRRSGREWRGFRATNGRRRRGRADRSGCPPSPP